MPRLIVDDAGKRKAFRVTQGRLTVGSGPEAKLSLTASGVEEHHANLIVTPEGVRVQVLAPVTLGGEKVLGGEVELELGSKLLIGAATISVEAEAPEGGAPKAAPAGRSTSGGRARGAAGAKSTGAPKAGGAKGDAGRSGGKRAGAGRASGGASGGRRRGGRAASEKQGLPGAVKVGGAVVVLAIALYAISNFGSSSAAATNVNGAAANLENKDLEGARRMLDRVDRGDLEGDLRKRYDELLAEVERLETLAEEAVERRAATRFIDEELRGLVDKQFKTDAQLAEKSRLLLDTIADFRAAFPKHSSETWLSDTTYAADHAWVAEQEQKYGQYASASAPYSLADAEFRAYYFLDSEPRRYNEVFPVVEAAERAAADEAEKAALGALRERLAGEQQAYADARMKKSQERYLNDQLPEAARILMTDVQTLTEASLIDRAAKTLVEFEQAELIFKGLEQNRPEEFERLQQVPRIRDFVRLNLNDEGADGDE